MTSTLLDERISSDFLSDFAHFHGVISFSKEQISESAYAEENNIEETMIKLNNLFYENGYDILAETEDRIFIGVDMGSGFDYLTAYYDELINELKIKGLIKEEE